MNEKKEPLTRRKFIKIAAASALGATLLPKFTLAGSSPFHSDSLQVWSCGGLAEAFMEANALFEQQTDIQINYTGAFAGALGKSLLGGATTEIFAGRVLKLAKSLREAGKMMYFRPLCFTEYVIVTPPDNPAGIRSLQDLAVPGVRVILPLGASPPGGDAVAGILKKARIDQAVRRNMIEKESCVIKMMPKIARGKGDASIVERRLTCMPKFAQKVQVIPINEAFFPPGPLTFTIGVMKYAADRNMADQYIDFICSAEGQSIFQKHGFIPAISAKGKTLIEKLGVKDD
ncbi:molybdenum ABC transporter substrate-binding protein [Megasphaera cerevisiae DSM 20462]|uniref:Molybdenum ABC transporter substrate-binding protein n=1 Tax=Megasphaera cerevisiae DSM 20462 TaxID=1122219 RepID=A0A0J6WWL6_9FIRM|nr:substrate-binding domain-containing protein [Megasphaera cerevisiae]KMO86593.1 molybdenum ABC transporter substrate-binding protein [Megasphaera cerevisiae DSM 20462]OKY53271.1 molybdenum ABC transporter substrate-binding protein [Megasphaera cerevisiae]SJZ69579.1 molybdate transport system substrate-binding protein [Megasphaera cerevisiae DSM 20462]